MPRLPDLNSLGSRPVPQDNRPIVSYKSGIVESAARQGLNKMVDDFEVQRKEASKLEAAQAKAYVLNKAVEAKQTLADSPDDYMNHPKKYQDVMKPVLEQATSMISDPADRQMFQLSASVDLTQDLAKIQDDSRARQRDKSTADTLDLVDANIKTAATSADKAEANKLVQSSLDSINGLENVGAITAIQAQAKRKELQKQYAENWIATQLQTNPEGLQKDINSAYSKTPPKDQDSTIRFVIDKFEGGYSASDGNTGNPVNFGINQKANPEVDVKNLTKDQAVQIYKDKYWKAANIDSLPENMRLVAFDTVVNFGVGAGQKMIKEANGDPAKLVEIRQREHQALIDKNPGKYAGNAKAWDSRNSQLANLVGSTTVAKTNSPLDMLSPEDLSKVKGTTDKVVLEKVQQEQVPALITEIKSKYPNDVGAQLNAIDSLVPNPELAEKVKTTLLRDNQQERKADFGKNEERNKAALDVIDQGGDINTIPFGDLAALDPVDKQMLIKYQNKKNGAPVDAKTELGFYNDVMTKYGQSRDSIVGYSVPTLMANLPANKVASVLELRKGVVGELDPKTQKLREVSESQKNTFINKTAKILDINKDIEKLTLLRDKVDESWDNFIEENNGRRPTSKELDGLVNTLVKDITVDADRNWLNQYVFHLGSDTRKIKSYEFTGDEDIIIPVQDQKIIAQQWKEKFPGRQLTKQQMQAIYLQGPNSAK